MMYHALYVIFEKAAKFEIVGGALRVNCLIAVKFIVIFCCLLFFLKITCFMNSIIVLNSLDPDQAGGNVCKLFSKVNSKRHSGR